MSSVSRPLIGPESSIQASDWSPHLPPGPDVSVSPPSPPRRPSEVTITGEMRQITWKLPTLGGRLNMPTMKRRFLLCQGRVGYGLDTLIIKVKERKRNIRYLNIVLDLTSVK